VSATDADQGANSRLLYHIVDGNHDNAFVIEPAFSGLVKTNIVLDREIRDTYRITVIVTDEGSPQLTGTSTLRINIVDVNDNQPTFPPHSIISVSEGKYMGEESVELSCYSSPAPSGYGNFVFVIWSDARSDVGGTSLNVLGFGRIDLDVSKNCKR
jgi:hypothetical protein